MCLGLGLWEDKAASLAPGLGVPDLWSQSLQLPVCSRNKQPAESCGWEALWRTGIPLLNLSTRTQRPRKGRPLAQGHGSKVQAGMLASLSSLKALLPPPSQPHSKGLSGGSKKTHHALHLALPWAAFLGPRARLQRAEATLLHCHQGGKRAESAALQEPGAGMGEGWERRRLGS